MTSVGCGGSFRLGRWKPPSGERIVGDVDVHGNHALSDREIVAGLQTHSHNFKLGAKPLLDRADLAEDAERIVSMYAARGYFEARVVGYRLETIDEHAVRVHFDVEEGAASPITGIHLLGLDAVDAEDEEAVRRMAALESKLERAIALDVGDTWEQEPYEATKASLETLLRAAGFVHAVVLGEVAVSRAVNQVDVRFRVAPGPLARISAVRVLGNEAISEARVLRRVTLKAGDVADARRLRSTESGIRELNVFFSVSAQVSRPSAAELLKGRPATWANVSALPWPAEVPLIIKVQEQPMRELRAGLGASVDNERSDVFLRGGYRHRNLFGNQRYFDLDLKPAFVTLPTWFAPQKFGPGGDLTAEFRQPSVFEEYITLRARADYELDIALGYQSHTLKSLIALSRRFFEVFSLEVGYNLQWYRYFGYSEALTLTDEETLGLAFRERYLLAFIHQTLSLDLRDSVLDTRSGAFAELRLEESFKQVGSDFRYIRVQADLRGFLRPWRWLTLALHGRYSRTLGMKGGDVPLPARFFGGGASGVRGFGAGTMGPLVCESDDALSTTSSEGRKACPKADRVYVGGNVAALGSFEARVYLPYNFGLVAFVDVGEIWATASDVSLSELQVAVGPGIRYVTPFGPVRFDVGFLLTSPRPRDFVFHFSIGQAF